MAAEFLGANPAAVRLRDENMTMAEYDDDMSDDDSDIVDLVIEDDRWLDAGLQGLAHRAAEAVAAWLEMPDLQIVVMGCDDDRIADLNSEFRGKAVPTNVLSWPSHQFQPRDSGALPEAAPSPELGDIAISFDTCQREALEHGKSFANHVTHLLVHGTLHLAGYDHEDDGDAEVMENAERDILGTLDIPDPYLEMER